MPHCKPLNCPLIRDTSVTMGTTTDKGFSLKKTIPCLRVHSENTLPSSFNMWVNFSHVILCFLVRCFEQPFKHLSLPLLGSLSAPAELISAHCASCSAQTAIQSCLVCPSCCCLPSSCSRQPALDKRHQLVLLAHKLLLLLPYFDFAN